MRVTRTRLFISCQTTPATTVQRDSRPSVQLAGAEEKREYLETLGLDEPGLDRVIHAGYKLLDLVTFF